MLHLDGSPVDALAGHQLGAGAVERGETVFQVTGGDHGERPGEGGGALLLDRRGQQAGGREHARMARHQHAGDRQMLRQRTGMQRPGAAERDQGEAARVIAAADRDQADALGHSRVQHSVDAERRRLHGHVERAGDPALDGGAGETGVERHVATGEVRRVDIAEHHRGVGHRRLGTAPPVGRRARHRAGRARPGPQAAGAVEPGDRAAAGADRVDVDHRHAQPMAGHHAFGANHRPAALDQGDVAAGAADIDGDQVAQARQGADRLAADHSGRRAGQQQAHRPPARHPGRRDAAARRHHLQRRGHAECRQARLHVGKVAVEHRLHIGVEGGRRGALVFPIGRVDLGGERQHHLRVARGDQFRRAALMRRVGEREQKADGDRLDPVGNQRLGGGDDTGLVEGRELPAVGGDPPGNLLPPRARRQEHRRLRAEFQVVHGGALLAAELQHIAEAFGGDQAEPGALLLQHRIGRRRGAVHEAADSRRLNAPVGLRPRNCRGDAFVRIWPCGRDLEHVEPAVGAAADQVGKGAADIDPDRQARVGPLPHP